MAKITRGSKMKPFKELSEDKQVAMVLDILSGTVYKTVFNGDMMFIDYNEGCNINILGCLAYKESSREEMLEYKAKVLQKDLEDAQQMCFDLGE